MFKKLHNKLLGKKGENLASDYLKKLGYQILETNFRYSKISEIDIIAKDKDTLVFVEVKTRSSTKCGHPTEAINQTKLNHIFKAGLAYMQQSKKKYTNYRIDAISIIGEKDPTIEHLKNISLN